MLYALNLISSCGTPGEALVAGPAAGLRLLARPVLQHGAGGRLPELLLLGVCDLAQAKLS